MNDSPVFMVTRTKRRKPGGKMSLPLGLLVLILIDCDWTVYLNSHTIHWLIAFLLCYFDSNPLWMSNSLNSFYLNIQTYIHRPIYGAKRIQLDYFKSYKHNQYAVARPREKIVHAHNHKSPKLLCLLMSLSVSAKRLQKRVLLSWRITTLYLHQIKRCQQKFKSKIVRSIWWAVYGKLIRAP